MSTPVSTTLTLSRYSEERGDYEIEVDVSGNYSPGLPAVGPSYAHGGLPPEGAIVEDIVARDEQGCEVELTDEEYGQAEAALIGRAEGGNDDC